MSILPTVKAAQVYLETSQEQKKEIKNRKNTLYTRETDERLKREGKRKKK